MYKLYFIFAAIRILSTCLPQTGYIHPDEFFQSIEVIAERSFNVEVNKPWEFNATFPIRSVAPAYLIVGTSFTVLKILNAVLSPFEISLLTPYSLLICARLLMCCLSFLVDWSLYRVCLANSEKYQSRSLVLAISYVMIVYATRTFSNTIELVLFSLLLYYISESLIFTNINVRQREYINKRYNKAKTTVEKAKFHKLRLFLEDDSLRHCYIIATITTVGIFNRPTFIAYSIAPVFFWLYRGLGNKSVGLLNFHFRAFVFLLCIIPTLLLLILIDSFYFGYLTWGEIGMLQVTINNFVVTPFNFIKYNIYPTNLAQHGLHPQYLHTAVNIPILFNILGLLSYYNLMELFSHLIQAKYHYLPTMRSIKGLMMASFLIPLAALSVFPHQEPRFLIPIILPLVYLYGSKIYPEVDDSLVQPFLVNDKRPVGNNYNQHRLFQIWILINFCLSIFYGFIHQGGVVPVISSFNKEINRVNYRVSHHIFTSHIYTLPKSLFLEKQSKVPSLFLHEEGSKDLSKVLYKIEKMFDLCKVTKCKVHLVIPSSLNDDLLYRFYKSNRGIVISSAQTFYPHLSVEAPPNAQCLNSLDDFLLFPFSSILKGLNCFGLSRFEFKFK